jgi:RimJ/RimL family protein N-acetyltransferase
VSAPVELAIASLRLRPCFDADVTAYTTAQQQSHAHLARFEGWAQPVPSEAATLHWFGWCRVGWAEGARYVWCCYDAASGDLVGSVGLYRDTASSLTFQLGYWTLERWTNRGLATFAAAAATHAGLSLAGVERIEILHDVANDVSGRIPRRLGYRLREARSRARTAPGESGHELVHEIERAWYPRTYAHRLWVEHGKRKGEAPRAG